MSIFFCIFVPKFMTKPMSTKFPLRFFHSTGVCNMEEHSFAEIVEANKNAWVGTERQPYIHIK